MEEKKYLPIGSIVLLEGGKKKVMITGYCMQTEERPGEIFDYSGCVYPEGVIRSDVTLIFNHSQIKELFHSGYLDEDGTKLREQLLKAEAEPKRIEEDFEKETEKKANIDTTEVLEG